MKQQVEHAGGGVRRVKHRRSFTLVELLVVITVILILLGISLRVMSLVNRKAGVARTTWILEEVKNALGAYYSTYSTYPPVTGVAYQYEKTPMASLPAIPPDMHYSTGLVYFIFCGQAYNVPDQYHNPAAQRWLHYLEGIGGGDRAGYSNRVGFSWVMWTNNIHTIADAWGSELRYECLPPYSTFRLWSVGPNGADNNGGGDDLGVAPSE